MTSTILKPTQTTTKAASAATEASELVWSKNERIHFARDVDSMGLRQLWKLLALNTHKNHNTANIFDEEQRQQIQGKLQENVENNATTNKHRSIKNGNTTNHNNITNQKTQKITNCGNFADYIRNRDILANSHMSLLKFLAINALELSAPASLALLQQKHDNATAQLLLNHPKEWMQLSGHSESFFPTASGIVRKRISSLDDDEVRAYRLLSSEADAARIVPHFYGTFQLDGEQLFIELQDLLADFTDPCIMDIKLGYRTFLESEVSNTTLRPDLYKKMMAVDPTAPTAEEHEQQAITKLRYMLFREAMSSSHTHGFRIEALRMRGHSPQKNVKTVRTNEQIEKTISQFVAGRADVVKHLLKRLKLVRSIIERSSFFARHEIVGSSIFIVYDDEKTDAWLIDFAKSRELPNDVVVNHRSEWVAGNREEGLLRGLDELIVSLGRVQAKQSAGRKCY